MVEYYLRIHINNNTNLLTNQNSISMKKIIFSVMLLCSSTIGFAQLLDVASTEKANLPSGTKAYVAQLSPAGDYLLLSDQNKQGLQKFDLQTNELSVVTTAQGSSYDAKILDGGNKIVYRETQVGKDRLRKTSLKSIDLATGKTQTIVKATRNLQGVATVGGAVYAVNNGKLSAKSLTKASVDKSMPVASINKGQLVVTRNGKSQVISPNGQSGASYLWPSVSPDGTKVVYYLATRGTYVCNVDGSNPTYVGMLRSPKWYNNSIVIGMQDSDNGEYVTASKIIASAIDGSEQQVLTDASVIAMYPSATLSGNKIAFTTPSGEAYIINVEPAK